MNAPDAMRSADRRLAGLFDPASVAVIGASDSPASVGGSVLSTLAAGGFDGSVTAVHPTRPEVRGFRAVANISLVEETPDLAVICVPAAQVSATALECAAAGVPTAVVCSSGFAETGADGARLQRELSAAVGGTDLRLVGPNSLGVMNVHRNLFATFTGAVRSGLPRPGRVSFVSQSGAVASHCVAAMRERGIGLSRWVSTGNESDVDTVECLDAVIADVHTDCIVLYLEGVADGPSLTAAMARARDAGKQVIALKVGRTDVGARAAASHTGALVGSDAVYDAVFADAGALRVDSIAELVDVLALIDAGVVPKGRRTALVTVSGGVGILMADEATERGLDLVDLPAEAAATLTAAVPLGTVHNPFDATATAVTKPELLAAYLDAITTADRFDAAVLFLAHTGLVPALIDPLIDEIAASRKASADVPLVISMLASSSAAQRLHELGCPVVADPSAAVRAVAAIAPAHDADSARRAPGTSSVSHSAPTAAVSEHEFKQLLGDEGVPVLDEHLVFGAEAAAALVARLDRPVAMKIGSARVPHKSDIGGVILDVAGPDAAAEGYRTLAGRAGAAVPGADDDGVLVAPMAGDGIEVILGAIADPVFGPVVMIGLGGTLTELQERPTLAIPPVSAAHARRLVTSGALGKVLQGQRGRPAGDVESLVAAVVRFSEIADAWRGSYRSIEINPLLVRVGDDGVVALDALFEPPTPTPTETSTFLY